MHICRLLHRSRVDSDPIHNMRLLAGVFFLGYLQYPWVSTQAACLLNTVAQPLSPNMRQIALHVITSGLRASVSERLSLAMVEYTAEHADLLWRMVFGKCRGSVDGGAVESILIIKSFSTYFLLLSMSISVLVLHRWARVF